MMELLKLSLLSYLSRVLGTSWDSEDDIVVYLVDPGQIDLVSVDLLSVSEEQLIGEIDKDVDIKELNIKQFADSPVMFEMTLA